jgi:hypothetical protein
MLLVIVNKELIQPNLSSEDSMALLAEVDRLLSSRISMHMRSHMN